MLFEADYAKNYASILYQCQLSMPRWDVATNSLAQFRSLEWNGWLRPGHRAAGGLMQPFAFSGTSFRVSKAKKDPFTGHPWDLEAHTLCCDLSHCPFSSVRVKPTSTACTELCWKRTKTRPSPGRQRCTGRLAGRAVRSEPGGLTLLACELVQLLR